MIRRGGSPPSRSTEPDDIGLAVLTHAHPDHMGGALAVKERTGCVVAARELEKDWIQDIDLQYRQRPVPGFHRLVEGALTVDRELRDGELIDAGHGRALEVMHPPGACKRAYRPLPAGRRSSLLRRRRPGRGGDAHLR